MRKHLLFLLLLITGIPVIAQQANVQGVTLNATTNEPVSGITVQLKELNRETSTDASGAFYFENVPSGTQTIILSSPEIMKIEYPIDIKPLQNLVDLGSIYVTPHIRRLVDEGSVLLIEENAVGEDSEIGDFNVSSLMTSSNDLYISNTTFNFSAVRFRLRGYDNRYSDVYINGVKFNDPERGGFSYGLIGGLNDATRNKDVTNYNGISNYSFGQVGGVSNINTHAGNFAPGGRASVAYTNRSYNLRAMATYSTGPMNNGWAFTGSVGYRWADEGFIEGTFYNSLGYMLAAEKVINDQHTISLTTLGSPTQRAQSSPNVQETMTLLDNPYYNSYWGYQNGEKRNSRVVTTYEPSTVFTHKFQINKDTRLTTNLGYKYSLYGSTALNWMDARDPRPDYYRNLPSYYTLTETLDDYNYVWEKNITRKTQVAWDELYQWNYQNILENRNDGASSYMIEERHNDQSVATLSSILNTKLSDRVTLLAGIEASKIKGMHYKTVSDLMGGKFFLDIDQYSQRDDPGNTEIIQNDMNNPNRKTVKGDRFGYDYDIHITSANAWLQNEHRYNKWDLYYGFKVDYTSFYRYGNMRNGRAPQNSYGKGKTHTFVTQSAKLGLTYKLSGRHIFSGNVSYGELPPLTYNAYISPRTKDTTVPDLETEKVFSADIAYNLTTPIVRAKVGLFQTNFYDQVQLSSYYMSGSGSGNSFLNYAISGVNKMHRGIEAALEVKLNSIFTASFAGTLAEYVYTNRPTAYASYENGLHEDYTEKVYMRNYYVGGTPQTAGTVGLHAFYNYWFFDVNLNGFDRTYIQLAPNKRTERAISFSANSYEEMEERIAQIVNQEKFKGGFTLDLSIGRSMRIQRKYTLNINCQLNNILNNQKLKTGGFEQGRFDYDDYVISKFPNKYYYAQGFNMFLNIGLRF
ncbi:TonB-dependent receptor [Bacteroidales bacterium OttesenSCG-928-L03]|nr:TonB-dependent receptor [Bacteroidales bacterium OttesenSCG-928-L03]